MTNRASWANRMAALLVWALVTAGVSVLVARAAVDNEDEAVDVTAPVPPVSLDQRARVSLATKTIVPVVSTNATIVNYGGTWVLEGPTTSDELAYRLLDPPEAVRAQINGGPSGFECPWLGLGQAGVPGSLASPEPSASPTPVATPVAMLTGGAGRLVAQPLVARAPVGEPEGTTGIGAPGSTGSSGTGVTMRCAIPADVRVVAGLSGLMVLQMDQPRDVQALPVPAVVGSAEQGQVVVVHEDGTTQLRTVQLGAADIYNIEIVGGLAPEEMVLLNPTQADFAQAEVVS